ncbi:MAG: spermidine synthase [bacterium]|jgi:spermidine synthase
MNKTRGKLHWHEWLTPIGLLLLPLVALQFFSQTGRAELKILFEGDSPYHYVRVTEEHPYRYLAFDRTRGNQSVINLENPDELKFAYSKAMFISLGYLDQLPGRVLIVGLGGGTIPRIMAEYLPHVVMDIAEIDPMVVKVAEEYFSFSPTNEQHVHIQDGRMFLRRTREKYDLIILDAFNSNSIPFHLTTQEFFAIVKNRLTPNGVVASNLWSPSGDQFHYAHLKTLQTVFPQVYSFQAVGSGNYVVISTMNREVFTQEQISERVHQVLKKINMPLDVDEFLETFRNLTDEEINSDVLTDDFAPVDVLRAQEY